MREGVEDLTLDLLNEATQTWAELEYNRALHSELGCAPLGEPVRFAQSTIERWY